MGKRPQAFVSQQSDYVLITAANHLLGQSLQNLLDPHQLPIIYNLHPGISTATKRQKLINDYHILTADHLSDQTYSHLLILDLLVLYYLTPKQQLKYLKHHQQLTDSLTTLFQTPAKNIIVIPTPASNQTTLDYLHPSLHALWRPLLQSSSLITVYTHHAYHPKLDTRAIPSDFYLLLNAAQNKQKKTITIDQTQSCYPTHLDDIANGLIKVAFRPHHSTKFLLTQPQAIAITTIASLLGIKTKHKYHHQSPTVPNPKLSSSTRTTLEWHPQINLKQGLGDLYHPLTTPATQTTDQSNPRLARLANRYQAISSISANLLQKTHSVKILKLVIIAALIALIPSLIQTMLIGRSYISIYQSYRSISTGNYAQSYRQAAYADQYLSDLQQPGHITNLTTSLPIYKQIHSRLNPSIYLAQRLARTIMHGAQTADSANLLITTIIDPNQDPSRLPQLHAAVQYNLVKLNSELGFLQATIPQTIPTPVVKLIGNQRYQHAIAELRRTRQQLNLIQSMTAIVPEFTGTHDFVRYAFLFQNNNELRPTGGFIGSFAIVEFHKGQLHTWKIYDVYQADGQLQGYVPAPEPIQKYLGESGWYLRDANWSPDFPTAVEQIEWFITKELRTPVDGVIAMDLESIRGLIAPFQSFQLAAVDEPITADNFDQLFQQHIESDHFEGSRRKADTLTDLATQLKTQLANGNLESRGAAARHLLTSLNQKHILLNFHNTELQQLALANNWAGQTSRVLGYANDTITDHISIIDANLGVNKANAFVDRSISHNVDLTQPYATASSLEITYINHSTTESKIEGTYRNYLRVLIPRDAEVRAVAIQSSHTQTGTPNLTFSRNLTPEQLDITDQKGLQSVGFLVEVPKQHTTTVALNYYLPDTLRVGEGINRYQLQIIKQPGTIDDPYQLTIAYDPELKPQTVSDGFVPLDGVNLTGDTYLTYNTQLLTDQYLTVRFK